MKNKHLELLAHHDSYWGDCEDPVAIAIKTFKSEHTSQLVSLLNSRNARTARLALEVFNAISCKDTRIYKAAIQHSNHQLSMARANLLGGLLKYTDELDVPVLSRLIELIFDKEPLVSFRALILLGSFGVSDIVKAIAHNAELSADTFLTGLSSDLQSASQSGTLEKLYEKIQKNLNFFELRLFYLCSISLYREHKIDILPKLQNSDGLDTMLTAYFRRLTKRV